MAQVLDWQSHEHQPDLVQRAAKVLLEGRLVAFPTETVYGLAASALAPEGVDRLRLGKGRTGEKPMTLAVASAAEAMDWVPQMSALGRRLARRCWPGPLTLVFRDAADQGLAQRLSESVRQQVCPTGSLGLRVPDHPAILQTLDLLPGPLVLTSANRSGEPPATSAEQVADAVGEAAELILDDGPSRFGSASTVVEVNGESWTVLREGALSETDVWRQSARLVVFACSGNTCRSPMAEALFKKLLGEELGCRPEELPQRGIIVISAGLAAMMGDGAAAEAVQVAGAMGADLSGHRSRPLTANLLAQADDLIVMTRSHLLALAGRHPRLGPVPRLLSPEGADLADPIGCDQSVYRECARQIERDLRALLLDFKK